MVSENPNHDLCMRKAKSENSGKDCNLSVTSLNFHRYSLTYVCTRRHTSADMFWGTRLSRIEKKPSISVM